MSVVALQCPECRRCAAYNGRGACICGAYLVSHTGKPFVLRERTYLFVPGEEPRRLA